MLAKAGIETYLIERKMDNCKPCGGAIPLCMIEEFDLPMEIIDRKARAHAPAAAPLLSIGLNMPVTDVLLSPQIPFSTPSRCRKKKISSHTVGALT